MAPGRKRGINDGLTYGRSLSIIAAAMNLTFQRAVDRYLGTLLCRGLSWYNHLRKPASDIPPEPGIVVILLSEMGSLILARPLFEKLKSAWPGARIHAIVFERNREALELLELIPLENILSISDRTLIEFIRDSLKVITGIRRSGVHIAIDAELFARISSILSFLSGAGTRVGFHPHTQEGLYRGDFINRAVLYNPYQHFSLQLLSLAEAVTSETSPKNKTRLTDLPAVPRPIAVAPEEIDEMRGRLAADFPQISDRKLVLIYPGGGILPIRAWPVDNFQEICRQLISRGFAVGIIGLAPDRMLADRIVQDSQDDACINLAGYTRTIKELIALFHLSDLLITNDGGPGHIAALTPIRTIMLFGPETPVLYRPLGDSTLVLHEQIGCSPCLTAYNHRNSPCDGDNICMQLISSDKVLEEALSILDR